MTHRFADITFTDSVKAAQEHNGSRAQNDRYQSRFGPNDQLGSRETDFIAQRDTFYLATVSETGWPYVQHRGGPPGFLRVMGPTQMAYADFGGNTQLVSVGNVSKNDRCSIILVGPTGEAEFLPIPVWMMRIDGDGAFEEFERPFRLAKMGIKIG